MNAEIQKLLALADPIFKEIYKLKIISKSVVRDNPPASEMYKLLNSPQPDEWIIRGSNEFGEYNFNKVALIEGVMVKLFDEYKMAIVSNTIQQDKSRFASTTIVQVTYNEFGVVAMQHGIATEVAPTISGLKLATPKSASTAFKNACAKIGVLLGKDLNRSWEDEQAPMQTIDDEHEEEEISKTVAEMMDKINKCEFYEDAAAIFNNEYAEFKFYTPAKQIINAKPSKHAKR